MRIALVVEYDGRAYMGWERQRHGPSVQATLEAALARVAAAPVRTICAGRTDSGVHARGQVVHFECAVERPERAWVMGVNTHLPDDVVVRWAGVVRDDFHARFSALARRYRYAIYADPVAPALARGLVTWDYRPLDLERMARAAVALVGRHDFESYRARACQSRSAVRTVHRCDVTRRGALILLDIEANAFLHHMVRNIAGVLMAIGAGRADVGWAATVLAARDRAAGGVTAPPHGLYLLGVDYPAEFGIPRDLPATPALW